MGMLSLFPQSISIVDVLKGRRLAHADISASVLARAAELQQAGVKVGDRVAVAHSNGVQYLLDLLAIWEVGAVGLALSHTLTQSERETVAAAVRPKAWIGGAKLDGISIHDPDGADLRAARVPSPAATDLDTPAVILMTSGTTSRPKGVVHTHRSLRARLALNVAYIGAEDLAVSLTMLPMHFGHGLIGNTLTPLAAGATLVVWPEPGALRIAELGKIIDGEGVTFLSSVPSLWRLALKMAEQPHDRTLRRVHVGSAPLPSDLWRQIIDWSGTTRVVNMYGITETANWIGGHSAEDGPLADGLVGKVWGGAVRLRGDDGREIRTGRGEVLVGTPSVMAGYLDDPVKTEEALRDGWFATGDVGEIGDDGVLRLVGRLRNEINRGGIKVACEEVDLLLERHPDIREACTFPLPDALAGELVAAAIVLRDGAPADTDAIKTWCAERIRREAVPSRLFVMTDLPKSERGKLKRDDVRAAALATVAA